MNSLDPMAVDAPERSEEFFLHPEAVYVSAIIRIPLYFPAMEIPAQCARSPG
jgi:hypothetical protein